MQQRFNNDNARATIPKGIKGRAYLTSQRPKTGNTTETRALEHSIDERIRAALPSIPAAENIRTATGTWLYTGQNPTHWVSFAKLGSWYLLLYVAFVPVTLVSREPISIPATTARPSSTPQRPAG